MALTIAHMDHNSFLIRGWVIALVSSLFAFATAQTNKDYGLISYVAIPTLRILDAFYLHQERCFRCLYDAVAVLPLDQIDFSMDCKKFNNGRNTWRSSLLLGCKLIFDPRVPQLQWHARRFHHHSPVEVRAPAGHRLSCLQATPFLNPKCVQL